MNTADRLRHDLDRGAAAAPPAPDQDAAGTAPASDAAGAPRAGETRPRRARVIDRAARRRHRWNAIWMLAGGALMLTLAMWMMH